jgi:hypothetical protein
MPPVAVPRTKRQAPTPAALRARAEGRAAARDRRLAQRQALENPEPPSLIKENFLTEFEFAPAMEKDIRTIRRWRQLRSGPPWVKVGRTILYPKDAVVEFLKQQAMQKPCRRVRRAA